MLTGTFREVFPDLLIKKNLITPEQLETALELQKKSGETLENILINLDFLSAKETARIKGEAMGIPFIDFDEIEPDENLISNMKSYYIQYCIGYKVIPVSTKECVMYKITAITLKNLPCEININPLRKLMNREFSEKELRDDLSQLNYTGEDIEIILKHTQELKKMKLVLAMVDPLNTFALDEIRRVTWYTVEPAIATEESILEAIDTYFNPEDFEKDSNEIIKKEPWYKDAKITEGSMAVKHRENILLPLKYTEVKANIIGILADVHVTQRFYNDLTENIEAIYMFPLPHESAVNEFEIVIGDRVIKSVVKEKKEARKTYEKAKFTGKKAGLLEQERPSIFTVSVANIEPGQVILVNIRYYETIKYEDNNYEFVFPMTITPRYGGKDKKGVPESLEGRTSPAILSPHQSAGREVNIFINLDSGFELGNLSSPTHLLYIQEKGKSVREIQLSREGEIPNKDFILQYSSKGEKEESAVFFYREENRAGTFMFHLTPKMDYGPEEIIKIEIIFVLDRSGSMCGSPIEQARIALKNCLRTLRPGDRFLIITFDHEIEYLSERSLEFNDENLKQAHIFINNIDARGGTEILSALQHAFRIPTIKGYLRQIVFLTDGAVWNEDNSLKEITRSLGDARVFSFGIGPAVNRYFLKKIAEVGRGTCHFITNPQQIKEAVENFSIQMSSPVISDISLEFEGAHISDVYPEAVPDLYFGQILCLLGRFHFYGQAKGCLTGRVREGIFKQEFTVDFPQKDIVYPVIETIWARKHIDLLMEQQRKYPQKRAEIRDEITGIALRYHLMSQYTSLVAVEEEKEEREYSQVEKELITVEVPQILPEGLNYDSFDTSPSSSEEERLTVCTDLADVQETVKDKAIQDFSDIEYKEEEVELNKLKELVDESPIIRIVNLIITQAIYDRADYIHIEPGAKSVSVLYRIDGLLHEVMNPPKHIQLSVVSRIKHMAGLDMKERKIPQHGKIHLKHDGVEYYLPVWTLPTTHGEKIVLRILDKACSLLEPDKSGLTQEKEKIFQSLLSKDKGMILLTGPSESGKSTTLYSALNILKDRGKNICTLEDRIYYYIPDINRIEQGENLEKTLKEILEQDYHVIMVENICKKEIAEIILKAASTNHLILTSLPGDNTSDAVTGLISMGIDPSLISSALEGVIARRLVRKICSSCKEAYTPDRETLKELGINPEDREIVFYSPGSCDNCRATGYKGRLGISEVMVIDDNIRSLIMNKATADEIRDAALKNGMVTLGEETRSLLLQGITAVEEYLKIE